MYIIMTLFKHLSTIEASRGTGAQSVTVNITSCGFDSHP